MTSLSAEYRNRLHATQQSRRIRKAEERRNSGPVDVDDFYVPVSPSSQARRRSKTPQPNVNSKLVHPQGYIADERRSQSAPRSIKEQEVTPPSSNRPWANNGETVFCFQPGRRRVKAPRRPTGTVNNSDSNEKKSLSQLQLYKEIQKKYNEETQHIPVHPSAVQKKSNNEEHNNSRIDLRIQHMPDIIPGKKLAPNKSPMDDPRLYAASYYAKKAGVNSKSTIQSQANDSDSPVETNSKHPTHKTITRSMSQKVADCLLLSKTIFDDESVDNKRRRSKTSNPLTSLCFVDNFVNVSQDTIDITTVDVNSYNGRSPNVSALHDNSPFHNGTTTNKKDSNSHNIRQQTSTKKWYEDNSTNQTTTVTTSSSENEEELDDTVTHDTMTSDSIRRPPKVLNVMKDTPKGTKQQSLPMTPTIQLNPDDYDYSYRKRRDFPPPIPEDIDFLSEFAVNSALPEAPDTGRLIGPLQQRDLQRRPRGIFEHVMSNDDGDNFDEVTTACSTPYDESDTKAYYDAQGSGSLPDMANDLKLKYNQALLEVQQHRKLLAAVENQLKSTVLELQEVKSDLQKTKDDATERSRTYADATTQIVKERLDSDAKLQIEQETNKTLKDEVECLKREVISLSLELERAVHRSHWSGFQSYPDPSPNVANNSLADDLSTTSNKSDSQPVKVAEMLPNESVTTSNAQIDEATKALEFMSEKLQESQKEVTDLQSQLTAMRVASELYSISYEQLQRERDEAIAQKTNLQREMNQVKSKVRDMDIQTDLFEREMKETSRLKEEIVLLANELNYSNIRASDYATNVQRLEEELIRAQLHAAKYEIQASALEKELRDSKRTVPDTTHLQQQQDGQSHTIDNDISIKSHLESLNLKKEQSIERQLVEDELAQLFTSNSLQSDSALCAEDINSINRSSTKTTRGRGSSDLLDILRKKLESK